MKQRVVLSTIGTSMLTNAADPLLKHEIISRANEREAECAPEFLMRLQQLEDTLLELLSKGDSATLKRASAELNALLAFYEANQTDGTDTHLLIATDTCVGRLTNRIVEAYLKSKGFNTISYPVPELNTRSKASFDAGIKNLLLFLDQNIPRFAASNYEVVFNLTGGFKSLQGFLNTIGTFYADKIVYIFESGELISIPKLPIAIDQALFAERQGDFLRLAADWFLDEQTVDGIPETMLFQVDKNAYGLSNWGLLTWNAIKHKVLAGDPISLPGLIYERTFMNDYRTITMLAQRVKLMEVLAQVASLFDSGGLAALRKDGGLLYENYHVKVGGEAVGHFRVNSSLRVSCLPDDRQLRIRYYGSHDHVEGKEGVRK
jgi:putative CRISPR-associated protein (TIGR02619 family)